MFRTGMALVVVALLAIASLPAVSAFDAPPEEIFVWSQVVAEPGPQPGGQGQPSQGQLICTLVSDDPATLDAGSPCHIEEYQIGNTDTHVYFRWRAQSLNFGPLSPTSIVRFHQEFTGSPGLANGGDGFSFRLLLTAEELEISEVKPEGWADSVEATVDREAGILTARLPLANLVTVLENETVMVGDWFTVGSRIVAVNPLLGNGSWTTGATLPGFPEGSGDEFYYLQPYGSLVAPPTGPETIRGDLTGLPVDRTLAFSEPTSAIYLYNWSLAAEAFVLSYTVTATAGSVKLRVANPAGTAVVDEASVTADGEHTVSDAASGTWTIEVVFDEFVGSFGFNLGAPTTTGTGPNDGTGETENGAANGNETNGGADTGGDKGIPGPGLVLFVMALGAALFAARRRR